MNGSLWCVPFGTWGWKECVPFGTVVGDPYTDQDLETDLLDQAAAAQRAQPTSNCSQQEPFSSPFYGQSTSHGFATCTARSRCINSSKLLIFTFKSKKLS
uniref:Uncharacterized protein n=1 Tax=Helianthus annuus TaxID=4232 RepID=A0A251VLK8_HELAN